MIWARSAFGPMTASDRERRRVEREQRRRRRLRCEQHHRLGRRDSRQSARCSGRSTDCGLRAGRVVERAEPVEHARAAGATASSTRCLVDLAAPHRVGRARDRRTARARASRGRGPRGRSPPSNPAPNQSVRTKPSKPHSSRRMSRSSSSCSAQYGPFRRLYAVMMPERSAFADRQLERHERDLAQRALVDHRVDRVALELRVVAGEVLHRRRDASRLRRRGRTRPRCDRRAAGPRSSTRSCDPRAVSGGC